MKRDVLFRDLLRANSPEKLFRVSKIFAEELAQRYGDKTASEQLYSSASVVIFGAGNFGRSVFRAWENRMPRVVGFVDTSQEKQGVPIAGLPVESPSKLADEFSGATVVVAAMDTLGIENELKSMGITPLFAEYDGSVGYQPGSWLTRHPDTFGEVYERLADDRSRNVMLSVAKARMYQGFNFQMKGNWFSVECASSPQYFPPDLISLLSGESFLDCGAFDGDTVIDFAAHFWRSGIENWSATALEADTENARRTRNNLDDFSLEKVAVVNRTLGASSNEFSNNCRWGEEVRLGAPIDLDNVPWSSPPTFIKMDIEGAELRALHSGKKTLSSYAPKLAICIYHQTSHLLEIPMYLISEYPDYDLYIRHHRAGSLWETVCYGLPS
jgi:hypothetical protein